MCREHEKRLRIIHADVLRTELPYFDVCVANVPYNVQLAEAVTDIPHSWSDLKWNRVQASCASSTVSKCCAYVSGGICSSAERSVRMHRSWSNSLDMCCRPGDELYCRLSVNTQLLARVQQVMKVGKNNFRPPPKVESRVVRIQPRNPPPPVDFSVWLTRKFSSASLLICTGMGWDDQDMFQSKEQNVAQHIHDKGCHVLASS